MADATFVQTFTAPAPGVNVGVGLIAKGTSGFQYDPNDVWIVTQVEHDDLYSGETVSRVGYVSGFHTNALITNTCVDFWHDWTPPSGSAYKTTCEEMTNGNALNGDSGGTVYLPLGTGNEVEAVGMISGNYQNTDNKMCFTRVSRIQANFASEYATINFTPPPPQNPTITLTAGLGVNNSPLLAWTTYPGALNYDLYRQDTDGSCNSVGTTLLYSGTSTSYADESVVAGGSSCPSFGYYVVATTSNSEQMSNGVQFLSPP